MALITDYIIECIGWSHPWCEAGIRLYVRIQRSTLTFTLKSQAQERRRDFSDALSFPSSRRNAVSVWISGRPPDIRRGQAAAGVRPDVSVPAVLAERPPLRRPQRPRGHAPQEADRARQGLRQPIAGGDGTYL